MEKDLFVLTDENGNDLNFYKIGQFESTLTEKNYVVYTDKRYTDGKINLYCSIVREEDGKIKFDPLETEDDKKEFEKAIVEFQKIANKNTSD